MNSKPLFRTLIILILLCSNIGCDQFSKNIIREHFSDNQQVSYINNHLTFTRVENAGAFLSVGHTLPRPFKLILLAVIPLMVLGFGVLYILTRRNLALTTVLGICFMVGGGIGNIYDRIIYGSVTDFLHIDFVLFQTGVFNLADVSIMSGLFMIIVETYGGRWRSTDDVTGYLG
jgi:signal peptidase II